MAKRKYDEFDNVITEETSETTIIKMAERAAKNVSFPKVNLTKFFMIMECYARFLLQNICKDIDSKLKVIRGDDGLKYDATISNGSKTLFVQIKTTKGFVLKNNGVGTKNREFWCFHGLNKNYDGMLLFLLSIEDNIIWISSYKEFTRYFGKELKYRQKDSYRIPQVVLQHLILIIAF
jgi:hypothetical protein